MIIDFYTHIASQSFLDRASELAPGMKNIVGRLAKVKALVDLDLRFREMDEIPDCRQVISMPAPPFEEIGTPEVGQQLARVANDELAELCRKYPDRFIGFVAAVHLTDPDEAIKEAQRAIKTLGAKGVLIYNHIAGHPLDEPRFRPFFAAMAELDRPIWLHPASGPDTPDYASEKKSRFELWWCFGWPYDSSIAMARLVFDGLFDRHPNLQIITHHCGAMIPFFDGRLGTGMDVLGSRTPDEDYSKVLSSLKRPHMEYFKLFYGDTALFGATTGVKCGLDFFGSEHILFATDAPFGPTGKTYHGVNGMDLDPAVKQAIFYGNAAKLLRL